LTITRDGKHHLGATLKKGPSRSLASLTYRPISSLREKILSSGKRGTRLRDINYMSPVKFHHAPRPWRKNLIFQGSLGCIRETGSYDWLETLC
jgi:hypothetical protein